MATLQKIRNKSWLLLSVIGLGLLAFIFMDLGSFLGGDSNESKVIGNVLGEDVLKEEFQNDLNLYTSQNPGVPSGQAIDLVWDQHISRLVMQNEFDKLGIDVCDDEWIERISGSNVHPAVLRRFTGEGGFNPEAVKQDFLQSSQLPSNDPRHIFWKDFQEDLEFSIKFEKYQA